MSLIVRHCSTWYIFTSPSPPYPHPPAPPHTHTNAKQELACGKYVAESEHTYVCANFLSSTWHSYSHPPSPPPPPNTHTHTIQETVCGKCVAEISTYISLRELPKHYVAFCMGGHARLGRGSLVCRLDTSLLPIILGFCSPNSAVRLEWVRASRGSLVFTLDTPLLPVILGICSPNSAVRLERVRGSVVWSKSHLEYTLFSLSEMVS